MSPATTNLRRGATRTLALLLCSSTLLGGCLSTSAGSDGLYARPIGDAPVIENPTAYSKALACLSQYSDRAGPLRPHIAVGSLRDLTGQIDNNGGRPLTQGAMLMAISALGKAGIPLVERYETDVPKLEFDLANNKLISDEPFQKQGERRDYRSVYPGAVTGSNYFLAGGITELNTGIRSLSANASVGPKADRSVSSQPNANAFVMNIGMDLRLVDTTSLDIVDFVSYQKQIIGWQVGAGLFSFFGNQVLSIDAKASADEPAQFAVRSLVERAILQFVSHLYRLPLSTCLPDSADPLKGGDQKPLRSTAAPDPAPPARPQAMAQQMTPQTAPQVPMRAEPLPSPGLRSSYP